MSFVIIDPILLAPFHLAALGSFKLPNIFLVIPKRWACLIDVNKNKTKHTFRMKYRSIEAGVEF